MGHPCRAGPLNPGSGARALVSPRGAECAATGWPCSAAPCSEGAAAMEPYPWLILFPGLALTATLFSLNFLGDGLRDALDPQVTR